MPKISIQVGKRVRIDCNYEDYKEWERILKSALHDKFIEETTLIDSGEHGAGYWKSMLFMIGDTEYRIGGPIMPKEKDERKLVNLDS